MSRDRASVVSEEGMYDNHYRDGRTSGRGWLRSGADGEHEFWSMRPSFYAVPGDGPVGELFAATRRSLMRFAHMHFKVGA